MLHYTTLHTYMASSKLGLDQRRLAEGTAEAPPPWRVEGGPSMNRGGYRKGGFLGRFSWRV